MGHKKRNVALRSKPSLPLVVSGSGDADDGCGAGSVETEENVNSDLLVKKLDDKQLQLSKIEVIEPEPSSYTAIKLECERALTALRRGNHTKALRLMKEMCSKNENSAHSALVHRVQGTVCVKVASIIDDPNAKQRHLRNAIESARKAAFLSPNSIEFGHFYANLMYEAANDGKEYEEVVQECERALAIENPIDPGKESLQDESQQKLSTTDARIAHVQNELRALIQKSNIASISTWMKNLGNGEEKFRLIPIRRPSEDPMEVRLVQARRPNEIKKATKTPEERRKEIEVRVAAARLLQQKSESPQRSLNDGEKALDQSTGSGQRLGERRKSGNPRLKASSSERKDSVRSYWNSMTMEMKKDLVKIKIADIKAHFNSLKDSQAYEILSEAISFAEVNKRWKFWVCCRCSEKFADSEAHKQHVMHEHMGNLSPKMQSILPQKIENEWIDMLLNCPWKPLDVNAAVKLIEKQSNPQGNDFVDESYSRSNIDECKDCFLDGYGSEDAWDSSPRRKKVNNNCSFSTMESKGNDNISNSMWRECNDNTNCKSSFPPDSWPLSNDTECEKLLEKIQSMFQLLIRHKCLAASHLSKVTQFAAEELQSLASRSYLINYGVDQSPACICFLGAHELKKVLKFLQDLSHSCGVGRYSEKSNLMDDSNVSTQAVEVTEKVILDEYDACLLLDESFLPCKIPAIICHDVATADSTSTLSAGVAHEDRFDADAFLSWIFSGSTRGEQLALWYRTTEQNAQQGLEILQMLEKEFYHLQSLCERKCEHLSYEEALQAVEDICLEESKLREHVSEFVPRSYESVLRKRREELIESDNDVMYINNRFELDAISNVLKEAESLNVNQFGFEETYGGVNSHLLDLESGEDDWRTKDYLHQVDSCIEVAIQRQKEQLSVEVCIMFVLCFAEDCGHCSL